MVAPFSVYGRGMLSAMFPPALRSGLSTGISFAVIWALTGWLDDQALATQAKAMVVIVGTAFLLLLWWTGLATEHRAYVRQTLHGLRSAHPVLTFLTAGTIAGAFALLLIWAVTLTPPANKATPAGPAADTGKVPQAPAASPPTVPPPVAPTTKPVTEPANERIFVSQSVRELIAPYERYNEIQADKLFEVYKGKWLRVDGVVRRVTNRTFDAGADVYLSIGKKIGDPLLAMTFEEPQAQFVVHLPPGAKLSATCRIERAVQGTGLMLNKCEITKP
jgi:hypothetical protein